jgi:sphinganine-1-phosphate aldolase
MSLDCHKYGYALKGTSVVLYRSKKLRQSQYFCYGEWPGGLYSTPTVLGSRSGGLIAQTWASMMAMGMKGYLEAVRGIMETTQEIAQKIRTEVPEIILLGNIDAFILCFTTPSSVNKSGSSSTESRLNIYMINELMHEKGWILNAIQQPPSLHFCVTYPNVGHVDHFVSDLKASIKELKENPRKETGFAVIYGTAAAMPSGPVNELLKVYNDVVLKI